MNLEVSLGEARFRNPLVLASGTFGYGLIHTSTADRMGALVTKGITSDERAGNPPPRIWDSRETVVNSVGLENVGLRRFKREILPQLALSTPVYVNLAGTELADFRTLIENLSEVEKVSGFELNLSCPNVNQGGALLGQSTQQVAGLTRVARSLTAKPLWVKLTSNFCDVRQTAVAAADEGADAVVVVNTLNALVVDVDGRRPFLGGGTGGLSGPALRPHVLYLVREVARVSEVPVIASGGVRTGEDVAAYLLAGASLVQLGSVNLVDPSAGLRILEELEVWFERHGIGKPADIIGRLEES